jgi:hypothetical protein
MSREPRAQAPPGFGITADNEHGGPLPGSV